MAEELLPRLARNMAGVPTQAMETMIKSLGVVEDVCLFEPDEDSPRLVSHKQNHPFGASGWKSWVLPDEDISHIVAQKYLYPADKTAEFEMIWARWDMTAVHKAQPIIPDVVVSSSPLDIIRMRAAQREAIKSPDWWRQIAAAAWLDDECIAVACNTHMPNEYETYIFGDPRLNVDAGQPGRYVALHAERAVIAQCARRKGIGLEGASLYVTTFPCEDCAREIREAGVKKVFFESGYSVLNAQDVLRSRGIEIIQVVRTPTVA